MLDACRRHSRWIDVFCERGAFDAEQSRAVLAAGRDAGLGLRVHGNQLGPGRASRLAVEMGAASVDHCTYLDDADVEALAGSRHGRHLPAGDRLLDPPAVPRRPPGDRRRRRVAIATNTNPGSSYTTSMTFCIALAVRDMGMTIDEALLAATLGGARALRRDDVGHLAPGARADAVVLDAPSHTHLVYRPGVPLTATVFVAVGGCLSRLTDSSSRPTSATASRCSAACSPPTRSRRCARGRAQPRRPRPARHERDQARRAGRVRRGLPQLAADPRVRAGVPRLGAGAGRAAR